MYIKSQYTPYNSQATPTFACYTISMSPSPTLHDWNSWVKTQPLGSLYQTSIWAHFQEQIPGKEKAQLITITDPQTNAIMGGGFVVKHALPFSLSWLECPRGPIFDVALSEESLAHVLQQFIDKVRTLATAHRAVFLRIDPPVADISDQRHDYEFIVQKLGLKPAHASYFPQTTLIIDLTGTEEEMLQQMKPKGRYNIKVAQKHDIYVKKVSKDHLEEFYPLIEQTAQRDKFFIHDAAYYKTMLDTLGDNAALWIAYRQEPEHSFPTPVAGMIATYFADTATYYYGASCYDHRHMMAPYLLQWEVMRAARAQGYTRYDLLGIAPTDAKNHPWQGVTDFKTKFGGTVVSYAHAKEYVFKRLWYFVMMLRKKLRR